MQLRSLISVSLAVVLGAATSAVAQPVGTFHWQLQPFCNVVSLHVVGTDGFFTLDGVDDQCGAGQRAQVGGTASFNPDGTVGMGLTIVTVPGGGDVHVDATINLGTLSGTWRDSVGNAGDFVFVPGPGASGTPRPLPPTGLAPGSITSVHLAPGAVGAAQLAPGIVGGAQINPNEVQTRVTGTCPVGQYLREIQPNGTVVCEPLPGETAWHEVGAPGEPGFGRPDQGFCQWDNLDDVHSSAAFLRGGDGFVHLKGVVQVEEDSDDDSCAFVMFGCGLGVCVANRTVFVLPDGLRPARRQVFTALTNGALARITVYPSDTVVMDASGTWDLSGVVVVDPPTTFANADQWVSLDGISFHCNPAEPGCP